MRFGWTLVFVAACGGKIDPSSVSSAQVAAAGDDGSSSSSSGGSPPCTDVRPMTTIATAMGALAVDDTDIYVIEEDTSRIFRYSKCGGDGVQIYDGKSLQPQGGSVNLQVDHDFVYWTSQAYAGSIARIPKAGGDPQTVVDHVYQPMDFALDDDNVYWVDRGYPAGAGVVGGNVSVVPKTGGTPRVLAMGEPAPQTLTVVGDTVYWVDTKFADAPGAIKSIPKAGGAQQTLATNIGFAVTIAVSTDTIAWISLGLDADHTQQVFTIPIGGGEPIAIAQDPSIGDAIVTDGAAFYWGTASSGNVQVVELSPDGITTSVIGTDPVPGGVVADGASSIAVSGNRIWSIADAWIDNPSGGPQTLLSNTAQ